MDDVDPAEVTPHVTDHDRQIVRLWAEAAEDDWRGPVRVEPGWQDRAAAALARWQREHPECAANGSSNHPTAQTPTLWRKPRQVHPT